MAFPDQIITIGGAGKDIGMELLESEWVLQEILQPRPDPENLTVTILDTAAEEKNTDRGRIQNIRQKRDDIKSELRADTDSGQRVGGIEIRYKLITENIILNSQIDLTGDDVVPRIATGNGIPERNWWLRDDHIEENLNFAKGAVRKRGLGKAMYYKAYAEDDELATLIDMPSKGEAAIIAGMGGGTGSGLFIDIAEELNKKMPTSDLTLFGVLPNHTEGLQESANAFSALSELEYLSLTDNQIFKDRILMPIDPTGFDGKRGNRVESDQMIEEFDEAAVYLLLAYYNNQGMEDVFRGSPQFAPFTIGIPQVLRYNVEAIQEARRTVESILNEKQDALRAERDIYEEIDILLDSQYNDPDGALRGEEETDLENRLETFKSLLDYELFEELEYESVNKFQNILADATEEADTIGEQIDVISGSLRAGVVDPDERSVYADNVDAQLAEVLKEDLELLTRRKQILEKKSVIERSRVRRAIESILGMEEAGTSVGGTIRQLESQLEDAEKKRDQVDKELEEVTSELETLQEEQADKIATDVNRWERQVDDDISQLSNIDVEEVRQDLNSLQTALSRFVNGVINAESGEEVQRVTDSDIIKSLDSVENALQQIGLSVDEERQKINRSTVELKNAREAFINLTQEESTVEQILPWDSSTQEEKEDAQKTYRMASARLGDAEVFSTGPPSGEFSAEVEYNISNIISKVETRRRELQNSIVDHFRESLEAEASNSDIHNLRNELKTENINRESCREIVRKALREEIDGTDDIESRRDNLAQRLDDLSSEIDIYTSVIDLFETVSNRRREFEEHISNFREKIADFGDDSAQSVSAQPEEYVYVKGVQPQQVFQATGSKTLAQTGLLNNEQELNRIRDNMEELASNTLNRTYTSLQRRKLKHQGRRYTDIRIRTAVMSQAIDQLTSDAIDLEAVYKEAFDLEGNPTKQRYSAWNTKLGGNWDIGLAVFIDGIFFDNIRKAVQADGYYDGYYNLSDSSDIDIRIHHSLGLDSGYYTRRAKMLNLESLSDVGFLLRDESEVVDDLLQNWNERIDFSGENATVEDMTDSTNTSKKN